MKRKLLIGLVLGIIVLSSLVVALSVRQEDLVGQSGDLVRKELEKPSAVKLECERYEHNYWVAAEEYWSCYNFEGPHQANSPCSDMAGLYEKLLRTYEVFEEFCNPPVIS